MSKTAVLVLFLLFGIITPPALGQARTADTLAQMHAAYERLDYEAVEALARGALESYQAYTVGELTEIHVLLGRVRFAQLRRADAREQFEAALSLTPSLVLDSLLVSPKVLAFFREVKHGVQVEQGRTNEAHVPRYVLVRDRRPTAALRSMLLPGWGQLYKGQEIKGWTLIGLWGGTLVGAGAAHLIRVQYRDAYLDARDPEIIEANYQQYSTWHKVRNNLLLGAALLWGYGIVDALLFRASPTDEQRALRLAPRLSPHGRGVQLQLRF